MNYLVMMRHGESQWNKENRFTGFTDVDLNDTGIAEAKRAGVQLKGIKFDKIYTSTLKRAYNTAELAMKEAGQNPPTVKHDDLRERDYGDLTGLNKDETRQKFGEEQVHIWRRSYDVPPPGGESLKDVVARVKPYFDAHILPDLKAGKNILLAAHGNTLRAMLIILGENTPENINGAEVATGTPMIFEYTGTQLKKESRMTTKATLTVMRHGQTDYNVQHLMTGQRDIPLNKTGEEQAREAGNLIKGESFDKVYASSLSRAFNTAAIALKAAGKNLPIEKRTELMELDVGDFTGRSRTEDPAVADKQLGYDTRWPGGESVKDLVGRVRVFYEAEILPRLARGENVLIVAHSVVLHAFEIVTGVAGIPGEEKLEDKKKIPNAAPTVYAYEDGVMTGVTYVENVKTTAANQNTPVQKFKGPRHG